MYSHLKSKESLNEWIKKSPYYTVSDVDMTSFAGKDHMFNKSKNINMEQLAETIYSDMVNIEAI